MPGAGTDLPSAVRRGRPTLIDRELHFLAATPTTKPRTSLGDTALVEETDVERVTAGDQWVGIDPVGISIADVELTDPVRNVKRHVRVTALVIRSESL